MTKKFILISVAAVLFFAFVPAALALRPGDDALELNVKWLQGIPRPLLETSDSDDDENTSGTAVPELKAIVFLLTRAANRTETVRLLSELRKSYAGKLSLMAVTPDSVRDGQLFLEAFPEFQIPFGVDEKRSITANYMRGSLLYPMAFLIDRDGRILWNGEAVDLAEAVNRYCAGTLDVDVQKKIAPMIDELQTLLRDDNDRRAAWLAESILAADPGNPTTLRLRLFFLERSERAADGWKLLAEEMRKLPTLPRLYFMALDLAMRNAVLQNKIAPLVQTYLDSVPANADSDNLMAWTLLNRAPGSSAALTAAGKLLARMPAPPGENSDALLAAQLTTRALYAYRLGKVEEARTLQQQAVESWRKGGVEYALPEAEQQLEYYNTVLQLAR